MEIIICLVVIWFVVWAQRLLKKASHEFNNAAKAMTQPAKGESVWFSRN